MTATMSTSPERRAAIFVEDFGNVDRPYEEIAGRIVGGGEVIFSGALGRARLEGDRLQVKVAPAGWPAAVAKTVEIHPGPVRAHGGTSLFPDLDADLEVAPLGLDQTQLTLRCRYRVPGGTLGGGMDRLVLHRVAQATIRAFLAGISERVCEPDDTKNTSQARPDRMVDCAGMRHER